MKILWLGFEKKLGIEKEHNIMILNKDTWDDKKVIDFKPDILIEREFNDGKSIYNREIEFVKEKFPKCQTAVHLIDTHIAYDRHKEYMKLFDYVFFAISKYAEEFGKFWLPLSYPLSEIYKSKEKPIYKIGFIGRWGKYFDNRNRMLALLKEQYRDDFYMATDYETVYDSMKKCKIIVNYSIKDDLNYRVFEALGNGNILVTNYVPDIYKIDGLAKCCRVFSSYKELLEMLDKISDKPDVFVFSKFIEENHLLTNRVNEMLGMIESDKQFMY